jgi:hypothetical protein
MPVEPLARADDVISNTGHFRFWHLAEIAADLAHVCFGRDGFR